MALSPEQLAEALRRKAAQREKRLAPESFSQVSAPVDSDVRTDAETLPSPDSLRKNMGLEQPATGRTAPSHTWFTPENRRFAQRSLRQKRALRAGSAEREQQRIALERGKEELRAAIARAQTSETQEAELATRVATIERQLLSDTESMRAEGERQLTQLRAEQTAEIEDFTRKLAEARNTLSLVEKERGVIYSHLKGRETELEEHRRKLLTAERTTKDKHTLLDETTAALATARKQRDDARQQLESYSARYATAAAHLSDAQAQLADATDKITTFERVAQAGAQASEKEAALQDALAKAHSMETSAHVELANAQAQDKKHRAYIGELETKSAATTKALSEITGVLLTVGLLNDRAMLAAQKALAQGKVDSMKDVATDLNVSGKLLTMIRDGLLKETPSLDDAHRLLDVLYAVPKEPEGGARLQEHVDAIAAVIASGETHANTDTGPSLPSPIDSPAPPPDNDGAAADTEATPPSPVAPPESPETVAPKVPRGLLARLLRNPARGE